MAFTCGVFTNVYSGLLLIQQLKHLQEGILLFKVQQIQRNEKLAFELYVSSGQPCTLYRTLTTPPQRPWAFNGLRLPHTRCNFETCYELKVRELSSAVFKCFEVHMLEY